MATRIGKPMKIALFRDPSLNTGIEFLGDQGSEKYMGVRVSEYVEVTFQPLNDEAVATNFIAALDIQEQKIRNEFQQKLDNVAEMRRNLLAITHKE